MFCSPHSLAASGGPGARSGADAQLDLFHRPQKNRGSFVPVSIGARFFATSSRVVYPALRNVKLSSRTVPEMSFVLVGTRTGTDVRSTSPQPEHASSGALHSKPLRAAAIQLVRFPRPPDGWPRRHISLTLASVPNRFAHQLTSAAKATCRLKPLATQGS